MATVMHRPHHVFHPRAFVQKICIGLGIFFVAIGIAGIVKPGFLGLHLSVLHNVIHLVSGVAAIWCGYSDDPKRAYHFATAFGVLYGFLGIAGFVMGEPGYPGVGHMEADNFLFRVIPNVLEFGTMDHIVHCFFATIFLLSAYDWAKRREDISRTVVETQGRITKR